MASRLHRAQGKTGTSVIEPLEPRQLLSTTSFAVISDYEVRPIAGATDSRGNVLVLGKFTGTVDFDPRPRHDFVVHSGDKILPSFFIAKYSVSGVPLWVVPQPAEIAYHAGGLELQAVTTDAKDNVYISGTLDGSFDANPSHAHVARVRSSTDLVDALIWELNSNGALVRTITQAPPHTTPDAGLHPGFRTADKIAVDPVGNLYLAAFCSYPLISRFKSNGKLLWSNRLPQFPDNNGSAMALSPVGDVGFAYCIDRPTDHLIIRLSRFSARGRFISELPLATVPRPFNGGASLSPADSVLASLAIDSNDDALIAGNAELNVDSDFDSGPMNLSLHPRSTDSVDLGYLAKYTLAGRPIFAKALSSDNETKIAGAGIDYSGRIHVTGSFDGQIDLNPDPNRVFLLKSAGDFLDHDLFSALYDGNGEFISGDSVHMRRVDNQAEFFGFAPYASSPRAAVLAVPGQRDDQASSGYVEFGISVFAK
jgi:hypothetical protein